MIILRKIFRQLSYGCEDPFENSKCWANFTKNWNLFEILGHIAYCDGYFFHIFFKRCREIFWRMHVGQSLGRTSEREVAEGFLSIKSISDILYPKIDIFHTFFKKSPEGHRKDARECKSQEAVGSRKFHKYVSRKKQIGRCLAGSTRKEVGKR